MSRGSAEIQGKKHGVRVCILDVRQAIAANSVVQAHRRHPADKPDKLVSSIQLLNFRHANFFFFPPLPLPLLSTVCLHSITCLPSSLP